MKKKIAGIALVLALVLTATSLVFAGTSEKSRGRQTAETKVDFSAELQFDSAVDNYVTLKITNHGSGNLRIASQAHYMDEVGSAGSWDCSAEGDRIAGPGQTEFVDFEITEPVTHGDHSILAFFFQYGETWYLGKVGKNNGVEYFRQHN